LPITPTNIRQWFKQQAISRKFLLLHLHYDIYDTISPELFLRTSFASSGDDDTPHPPIHETDVSQNTVLLLFLNSELGHGNTGVVHGGILEIQTEDRTLRQPIAAKLSFSDEQRERLQDEWLVLTHLASQGVEGIPTLLGMFHNPNVATGPLCLLMGHVGKSLRRSRLSITTTQR
jgi:hypothetical protein